MNRPGYGHLSALGNAALAGWAAWSGTTLLEIAPRWIAPGVGIVAFILALFTSRYR